MKSRTRIQRLSHTARQMAHGDAGYVLLWVIFGFVVMGAVATAALLAASTERRSSKAVADWGRSLYLAETGIQEIMETVTDSALDELNPGDSLVIGRTALPQGGSYTGVLHRVDNGGQLMYSLSVQGKRRGTMSGVHTVAMLVTRTKLPAVAAVAVEGDLLISGNPTITGTCGDLSVDGRLTVSGELTIDGDVRADETVLSGGNIVDSNGRTTQLQKLSSEAADDLPEVILEPDRCAEADVTVEAGQVTVPLPTCADTGCTEAEKLTFMSALDAGSTEIKYDPSTGLNYLDGSTAPQGTVCVSENLVIGGNLGTELAPVPMTVLSDGSVEISGNPYMVPADPDALLIQAAGDLKLNGNSSLGPNYTGDISVGGQCEISGDPGIEGQVVCAGDNDGAGADSMVVQNEISGDMSIHFDCPTAGGGGGGTGATAGVLRPIRNRAWTQRY